MFFSLFFFLKYVFIILLPNCHHHVLYSFSVACFSMTNAQERNFKIFLQQLSVFFPSSYFFNSWLKQFNDYFSFSSCFPDSSSASILKDTSSPMTINYWPIIFVGITWFFFTGVIYAPQSHVLCQNTRTPNIITSFKNTVEL